jgi:hypothetical protein
MARLNAQNIVTVLILISEGYFHELRLMSRPDFLPPAITETDQVGRARLSQRAVDWNLVRLRGELGHTGATSTVYAEEGGTLLRN